MATQMNEFDDPTKKVAGGGGQVLAGSGGVSSPASTDGGLGSGWTNLQTYLGANKGGTEGVTNQIIGQGQTQFNNDVAKADGAANTWADGQIANKDWGGSTNALEQGYQDVAKGVDSFGNDQGAIKSGLQKANGGYDKGFGALDSFLGVQGGQEQINKWKTDSVAGLKDAGQFKGVTNATNKVAGAQNDYMAAEKAKLDSGDYSSIQSTPMAGSGDIKIDDNIMGGSYDSLLSGLTPAPVKTAKPAYRSSNKVTKQKQIY